MEITITLSAEDTERLYQLKEHHGRDSLTFNEYAKELLELEIFKLWRELPRGDQAL